MESPGTESDAVVGDECHIISKTSQGPRGAQAPRSGLDGYDNLILLCKTHHKLVDDQTDTYNAGRLRKMKTDHEAWVRETLATPPTVGSLVGGRAESDGDSRHLLKRIRTGGELLGLVRGTHMLTANNDDPSSEDEVDLLSRFFTLVQDYGDLDLDAGQVIRLEFELSREIDELLRQGFLVYGSRATTKAKIGSEYTDWKTAIVSVVRNSNPSIIRPPGAVSTGG